LRTIEATSAVSPKAIPQLADNQALLSNSSIQMLIAEPSTHVPVLVLNVRGLDIAIKHGVKEVAVFVRATEGFSKASTNCTVEEGLRRAGEVAALATKSGLQVRGCVSTLATNFDLKLDIEHRYISRIFEDPFDGPTSEAAVLHVVRKQLEMGCYEVSLGDTLGTGTASDVIRLLQYLYSHGVPAEKLAGHFHDTYGQAVSNAWTASQLGVRAFDSSVGGLGGCPYAPGAKGNVATEDLVYLFERAGVSTDVNLAELAKTGQWISEQLGNPNDSRVGTALYRKGAPSASPLKQMVTKKLEWTPTMVRTEGLRKFRSGLNIKIVLDRPKNGNALTVQMISALTSFFESAATDRTISRIALTASGKFFCTGMNLGKGSAVAKSTTASNEQFNRLSRLFEAISNSPQVTIAAVNGHAFGGGVSLAFVCDIRMGAADATFTLSEVKLGLSPATISKYVAREWGPAFTREAMLSDRPVSFAQLRSLGLVSTMVDSKEALDDSLDA
jgi:hydroxymethylglutaryl-CoA lyase